MDYFKSFKSYLLYEKRASSHTAVSYLTDLKQFADYLTEYDVEFPEEVEITHVRSWLTSLSLQNLKPASINRKLSSVRTFYRFLRLRGLSTKNPLQYIKGLKKGTKIPTVVKESEIAAFYQQNPAGGDDFKRTRDLICLDLLYSTGVRRAELKTIRLQDVDRSRKTIRVMGKGGKVREIPVSDTLLSGIDHYCRLVDAENFEMVHSYLLVTDKGQPLYDKFIYLLVKKYLGQISSVDKKSPHVLRHSFATHLMDNGASLSAVKDLLGHASLASTEVYLHHSMKKIKSIYKDALPRQNKK